MQQGGDLFREVEAVEEEVSCTRDREVISLRRRRWRHKRRRSRR